MIKLKRKILVQIPYYAEFSESFIVGFTELKKHHSSWALLVPVPPCSGGCRKCFLIFTNRKVKEDQTVCPKHRERWFCITGKCCSFRAALREWAWVTRLSHGLGSLLYFTHEMFISASSQWRNKKFLQVNFLGNYPFLGVMKMKNFSTCNTLLWMCDFLHLFWSLKEKKTQLCFNTSSVLYYQIPVSLS